MTSEQAEATVPAGERRPARDELTIRVFRALYREFDLHTVAGTPRRRPERHPLVLRRQLGQHRPADQRARARDGVAQTKQAGTSEDGTPRP